MDKHFSLTIALLVLAACGTTKKTAEPVTTTVEVAVPVSQARAVPPELLEPIAVSPGLVFMAPLTPGVTSGLTPTGEAALRAYIEKLTTRLHAWREWAKGE